MNESDLREALQVAETAARAGGEELRSWQARFTIHEKGRFDLVTDADRAAHDKVHQILEKAFPEHAFLGEETPSSEREKLLSSKKPLWVVDPLDGTTNYIHRNPCFAVSIGLVHEGHPVIGTIYDPSRDELFSARTGSGASLNGESIRVTQVSSLSEALIAMGFPADWRKDNRIGDTWTWFGHRTQGMRRTGSSALNLAYLGAGRFDGFVAFQQWPWDVAAGMLIVSESGGLVNQADGEPYDVLQGSLIAASNGALHPELLRGLRESMTN
jgi:myo-inositol-1(or 4)-monophosphatase